MSNVNVNNFAKPSFLSKQGELEFVSFAITKRYMEFEPISSSNQADSFYVFTSSNTLHANNQDIVSFQDYMNLSNGSIGDVSIKNFTPNVGERNCLHDHDDTQTFVEWKADAELDLVVLFGIKSIASLDIDFYIEERIEIIDVNNVVETPTPFSGAPEEPTPTPTPITTYDLSSWFTFNEATLNVVNGEIGNVEISDISINESHKPEMLGFTYLSLIHI